MNAHRCECDCEQYRFQLDATPAVSPFAIYDNTSGKCVARGTLNFATFTDDDVPLITWEVEPSRQIEMAAGFAECELTLISKWCEAMQRARGWVR